MLLISTNPVQTPRTAGRVPLTQSLFLVGVGLRNEVLEAMALTLLIMAEIHDDIWFPMTWAGYDIQS